jgi:YHS domain-containing protein
MSIEPVNSTERQRDPVCGMSVRVAVASQDDLVADHDGHAYYFCRAGCRDEFVADPARFIASHAHTSVAASGGAPVIDDGMRRWYESCSCCLSDAYPEVKAALDMERAQNAQPEVGAGICEVAEAEQPANA